MLVQDPLGPHKIRNRRGKVACSGFYHIMAATEREAVVGFMSDPRNRRAKVTVQAVGA